METDLKDVVTQFIEEQATKFFIDTVLGSGDEITRCLASHYADETNAADALQKELLQMIIAESDGLRTKQCFLDLAKTNLKTAEELNSQNHKLHELNALQEKQERCQKLREEYDSYFASEPIVEPLAFEEKCAAVMDCSEKLVGDLRHAKEEKKEVQARLDDIASNEAVTEEHLDGVRLSNEMESAEVRQLNSLLSASSRKSSLLLAALPQTDSQVLELEVSSKQR